MLEHSVLKIAAAKTLGMALPLGVVALGAAWVWRGRERRSAAASEYSRISGSWAQGERGAQRATATQPAASGSAASEHRGSSSSGYTRGGSVSSLAGGVDQDALLSRIMEDNVRLRESLKQH